MREVALYGFGLIGGSIALSLRAAEPTVKITAIDREPVLAAAQQNGLADALVLPADREALEQAVRRADLTVLACPVSLIVAEAPVLLEWCQVLTDCGSTKREIAAAVSGSAQRERFVLGHPMAGGPRGGLAQARADLFKSQSWLLCPEGSASEAVHTVEFLIGQLGAHAVHLSAATHDRSVARTSHVPQIVASALAVLVDDAQAALAAGPAFRSATRAAGGEEAMWRDIFASNGDEIAAALDSLLPALARVRNELGEQPPRLDAALRLLSHARTVRHGS